MELLHKVFGSPFRGILHDIKGRLPYYVSDWTDGWNYRVIPATVYMYFTNLLPAIAFAQDMFDKTNNSYGVNEVLLSSAIGGIVFGLFAGQPLCIVGVTGPIAIFNYTVYEIVVPKGIAYFPFMCWICLWSMVMHFAIAIFNWVNGLRYVTRFSCDIFGFFISFVYVQKGIQILTKEFEFDTSDGNAQGYLSIIIALLVMVFGMLATFIGHFSPLFWHPLRKLFADYGLPLTVVFFTGFAYFPGRLADSHLNRLNVGPSFTPTATSGGRTHGWFIHFWDMPVGDIFLAIPFGVLLTILFYFDHNVSSLICQGSEYPLKKPASFHWDFFLLGITTGVAGLIGIPAPNGLIPQAPLHTSSLCVTKFKTNSGHSTTESYISSVVEQRLSNLGQGLLILGTMSGPLLTVLGLLPKGVLAGLFWMMGISGLMASGVTAKLKYVFSEKAHIRSDNPLNDCRKKYLYGFVLMECLGTGAEFAIIQTIAAVGFPAVLMASVVVGMLLPKLIPDPEISILDGPTGSDFILRNLQSTPDKELTSNRTLKDSSLVLSRQDTVESMVIEDGTTSRMRRRSILHGRP
jgi:hypothetical protein